jgi:hypothetical protein
MHGNSDWHRANVDTLGNVGLDAKLAVSFDGPISYEQQSAGVMAGAEGQIGARYR